MKGLAADSVGGLFYSFLGSDPDRGEQSPAG
jgi:hypothetical protein